MIIISPITSPHFISLFRLHHHRFASIITISPLQSLFCFHHHHFASTITTIIILHHFTSFHLHHHHFAFIIIIPPPSSSFQLPSMENGLLLHFIFFIFLFHFKFRSGFYFVNKKNETIQHSRIGKYFLFLFLNIFTSIFFLISNNLFILFFNLNIFFRFGSGPTV